MYNTDKKIEAKNWILKQSLVVDNVKNKRAQLAFELKDGTKLVSIIQWLHLMVTAMVNGSYYVSIQSDRRSAVTARAHN